jgi:hypothetical protein
MVVVGGLNCREPLHASCYPELREAAESICPAIRALVQVEAVDSLKETEGVVRLRSAMCSSGENSSAPQFGYAGDHLGQRESIEAEGVSDPFGDLSHRSLPVAQLEDRRSRVIELVHLQRFRLADHEAPGELGYVEARRPLRLIGVGAAGVATAVNALH